MEKSAPSQGYKTLRDLCKLLSLFNSYQVEERGVNEISKTVGMLPSKVSRMLKTMKSEGFFEKNLENGKYRLGLRFFELGLAYASNLPLRKILRPHLEKIFEELKVTVSWGILRDNRITVMDRVQNLNIDMLAHRLGLNLPIHSTSIGKALLAYLSEKEQDRILECANLVKFTKNTITDKKLIKKHLNLVLERGYSTDEQETHEDLNCIAVPIRNAKGEVVAAVNVMDEKQRTSAEKLFGFADYLKEKALFVSRQIGYMENI